MKFFKIFILFAVFGLLASSCASAAEENWSATYPEPVNVSAVVDDILTETISYSPMLDEVTNYWNGVYEIAYGAGNSTYVRGDFLIEGESTNCGSSTVDWNSGDGPEYCIESDNIIIPVNSTKRLYEISKGRGEAGIYAVIAHEFGHNIEGEVLGYDLYAKIITENIVLLENAADCLAGVTIAGVNRVFSAEEVDKIVELLFSIGESDRRTHGTPEERASAIMDGMRFTSGSEGLKHCLVTYIPGYI
jgi:predicted metalloprotease